MLETRIGNTEEKGWKGVPLSPSNSTEEYIPDHLATTGGKSVLLPQLCSPMSGNRHISNKLFIMKNLFRYLIIFELFSHQIYYKTCCLLCTNVTAL